MTPLDHLTEALRVFGVAGPRLGCKKHVAQLESSSPASGPRLFCRACQAAYFLPEDGTDWPAAWREFNQKPA